MDEEILQSRQEVFKPPGIENPEKEAVAEVLLFRPLLALLHFNGISKDNAHHILSTLLVSLPPFLYPIHNTTDVVNTFHWYVSCISQSLNIDLKMDPLSLYIETLKQIKSESSEEIYQYLSTKKVKSDEIINEALFNFYNENHALYIALSPYLPITSNTNGGQNLICTFGPAALQILNQAQLNSLDANQFSANNAESIFQLPTVYLSTDFAIRYQMSITLKAKYPRSSIFHGGTRDTSLFNITILSNNHFVDIACQASLSALSNNDIQLAFQCLELFPKLLNWTVSVFLADKTSDYEYLASILPLLTIKTRKSISSSFLQRLENDLSLFTKSKQYMWEFPSEEKMKKNSLPMVMKFFLRNLDFRPFEGLYKTPYYFVNDGDRKQDADFISSYFAIALSLGLCEAESFKFTSVQKYLSQITDKSILDAVVIDLFSLLFIKNDKYIFSLGTAKRLLSILTFFKPEIQAYYKRIEIISNVSNSNSMEAALVSLETYFASSIYNKKWNNASLIVKQVPSLEPILANARKGINEVSKNEDDMLIQLKSFYYPLKLKNLDSNSWEIMEYPQMSSSVSTFIHYLDVLVPILLNAGYGQTVSDVLSVPPNKLISYLLRKQKNIQAQEVAKFFKKDFYEVALTDDSIELDTIRPFYDNFYILEEAYNLVKKKEYKSKSKYINNLIHQKAKVNNKAKANDILELLDQQPLNIEVIAEKSYQLDYQEFDEIIESKLQILPLPDLFSIVKNSASSKSLYDSISTLYFTSQLGIEVFPLKLCLSQLLKAKEYTLASKFCTNFRYKVDITKILREELLSRLKANQPYEEILAICPSVNGEILDSLPKRFSINKCDFIFEGWEPANDPVQLLKKNFADTERVIKYLETFRSINFDMEFLSIFKNTPVNMLLKIVKLYTPVYREIEKILQPLAKHLLALISTKVVNSNETEIQVEITIPKITSIIEYIFSMFNTKSQFYIVLQNNYQTCQCICDFVSCGFYKRFGIIYSFRNFLQKEVGSLLLNICYKYDYVQIALKIATAWKVRANEARELYAKNCYMLSHFEAGVHFSPNRRRTTSIQSLNESTSLTEIVQTILTHPMIYDTDFILYLENTALDLDVDRFMAEFNDPESIKPVKIIQKSRLDEIKRRHANPVLIPRRPIVNQLTNDPIGSQPRPRVSFAPTRTPSLQVLTDAQKFVTPDEGMPNFYLRIVKICQKTLIIHKNPDHIKVLHHFLKIIARLENQISFFVKLADFPKAFKYIMRVSAVQVRWNLFLNSFIADAICYNTLNKISFKNYETLKFFGSYFEKLLKVAQRSQMFNLQYQVEFIIGKTDQAALTALLLFSEAKSDKDSFRYLVWAQSAVNQELTIRKNQTKKLQAVIATEKLIQLSKDIALQQEFCKFCRSKELVNCYELNLFHSPYAIEAMTVLLFREYQFSLALEMMNHCCLKPKSIAIKLIDVLVNESTEMIQLFIDNMWKEAPDELCKIMMNSMMGRLFFVFRNQRLVQSLIIDSNIDHEFKCQLMIQYFKIDEAFNYAKKEKLIDLLPLIGNIAARSCAIYISEEIVKLFDNRK